MKKISVIFAALALLAASCTKTEVVSSDVQSSQRGIGFSAYTAKPTKAAQKDVDNSNLNSFQVTAIGNNAIYFDDVTFTKGATVWESNPAYFWPVYALDFYAYNTPEAGNGTFTRDITTANQKLIYSPAAELEKQEDLVAVSTLSKNESDNNLKGAIDLTFNHYLTQVIVKALCTNSNYIVKVEGVKLANMAGEGTYTFSTDKMLPTDGLVNSDTSSDYDASFTSKTLDGTAKEMMTDAGTGRWYLVPQDVTPWKRVQDEQAESPTNEMKNASHGTYLALKVKITSKAGNKIYPVSGDAAAWMAVPVPASLAFEQGTRYSVTIKFFGEDGTGGAGYVDPETPGELDGDLGTEDNGKKIIGGAIKFDATVSEWGDFVDVIIAL